MEAAFCVETLEDAMAHHGKPDIFNTDQGSQFTGQAFTGVLANNGIAISMDGKGAWRDNVFVERLWRSVKYEEVYLRAYDSVSAARASIGRYLDFYNAADRIRALTTPHPIKLTSPSCPSAWQPNLGRRSTYRRGKSVQTTETTSKATIDRAALASKIISYCSEVRKVVGNNTPEDDAKYEEAARSSDPLRSKGAFDSIFHARRALKNTSQNFMRGLIHMGSAIYRVKRWNLRIAP
jgi:hypothetical protein